MRRGISAIIAAAAVALALDAKPADASYTIYAPNAVVAGQSIADWTAAWWTWAGGLPAVGNAFDDPNGALAHQNNNGPVFFAAGWFSLPAGYTQPPVMRSFSVQASTPILIPLVTQGVFQLPAADVNFILNSFSASSLTATINGTPVQTPFQYFEKTGIFSAGPILPNTISSAIYATPGFPGVPPNCPATDACPSGSVGYWLMLDLSPGVYVIDTGGTASVSYPLDPPWLPGGGNTFSFATDYTITAVAPEPSAALLLLPGLVALSAIRRCRALGAHVRSNSNGAAAPM